MFYYHDHFSFFYPEADQYETSTVVKIAITAGLLASLYCMVAGFFLSAGWQDPLAGADLNQTANLSARAIGRGGLVILAIRIWPYFLIGIGGFFALGNIVIIWRLLKHR
jgi:hypothetical protein